MSEGDIWSEKKAETFRSEFLNFLSYCVINSKETGPTCLGDHIFGSQTRLLDAVFEGLQEGIHDFKCLKSRQLGCSTFARAFALFWLGVHPGLQGALILDTDANKEAARREIENMIDGLPPELKFPRIKSRNRYGITLDNNSKLNFLAAGNKKGQSNNSLGASLGLNFVIASEMCSWGNIAGIEALKPTLSRTFPNRLFLWESTARGPNLWQDMWQEAVEDTLTQRTIFLGWWSRDDQRLKKGTALFSKYGTEPPTTKELQRINSVRDKYGVDIDMEQLAWFRQTVDPNQNLEEDESEDPLKTQEQPWCVVGNTRVGTDRGILKITDVAAGMNTALGGVVKSFPTGTAQIWRATTYLGYSVEGTGNHPLINIHGDEIELQKSINSVVKLQPPRMAGEIYTHRWADSIVEHSVKITPEIARFVGIFMGDGTVSGPGGRVGYQFSIACDAKDRDFIDLSHNLVRTLFGVNTQERTIGGCTDVRCSSKLIYETLVGLGLTRTDTIKTMRKVHVPEFIWRSPKEVVAEFLRGLFETDGFVDKEASRVSLFSKYEDFIPDIQRLLLAFGITCRIVDVEKINGDGRKYRGRQLELRASEAEKFISDIGFLSERKKSRAAGYLKKKKTGPRKPISMADMIVRVEPCVGRVEPVYNLTTDGNHWYDANGIVTHNTEEEAFQITGSSFFAPGQLSRCMGKTEANFQAYRFTHGTEFFHTTIERARSVREAQLKVWEEPQSDSTYIIACDPAYGHDPLNNNSAIQVIRCYADKVEQVAEFGDAETPTTECAWVLAAICGYYAVGPNGTFKNPIEVIIEINGPGEGVFKAFREVKMLMESPHVRREATERGIKNIFQNVRNYVYARTDSYSRGDALMWKTSGQLKEASLVRLRDFLYTDVLLVRSMSLLQEMQKIIRDGETIGAPGMQRDDKTIAMAMATRSWEDSVRRRLMAEGKTKQKDEDKRKVMPADKAAIFNRFQIESFMKKNAMKRIQAQREAAYNRWRYGR